MISNTASRTNRLFLALLAAAAIGGCASAPETGGEVAPPLPEPESRPLDSAPAPGPQILKPDYPQRHTVVKGDTLWDIAARFLKDPWRWPEVWHINPDIPNPHLIYPGDVIVLHFQGGRPVLSLQRETDAPKGLRTVKLTPQTRIEDLDRAVPTIPMSAIGPFLSESRVVSRSELDAAPHIVSSYEEHLVTGAGHVVYASGMQDPQGRYTVVRAGQAYTDPDTGEHLGYEAIHLAEAEVIRGGEPTTLRLLRSKQETLLGDRLLPYQPAPLRSSFVPKAPPQPLEGSIIDVLEGMSQIGQYHVVVLDRGERHGLEPGHVLAVYQSGVEVRDPLQSRRTVKLPDERAGVVMVFRSFDRVSYALVMEATRAIHVSDRVTNP